MRSAPQSPSCAGFPSRPSWRCPKLATSPSPRSTAGSLS
jgi:hypothetical protein